MRYYSGKLGDIFHFVRRDIGTVRDCPSEEFLRSLDQSALTRFDSIFRMVCDLKGPNWSDGGRFHQMTGKRERDLWEFKVRPDFRLFGTKTRILNKFSIVLLNGWSKDRTGGNDQKLQIQRALTLLGEYRAEDQKGGNK